VFGHRRAADRLWAGTGVAGGKLQDVRLVAGRLPVRVTHQRIELVRAHIVAALCVIAPTVVADDRASLHRIARQTVERVRRTDESVVAFSVKDALGDDGGS